MNRALGWLLLTIMTGIALLLIGITCCGFFMWHAQPDEKTATNAVFFTLQTITTTGYGAGFTFNNNLKWVASGYMIIGSTLWAVIIGIITNWIWDWIKTILAPGSADQGGNNNSSSEELPRERIIDAS